jgi:glycyl-tRNA synthetase (class II)
MPIVVWQHGKSFRNEQDKTASNMRLKEFYQLEFQIIFSNTTQNDYHLLVVDIVKKIL